MVELCSEPLLLEDFIFSRAHHLPELCNSTSQILGNVSNQQHQLAFQFAFWTLVTSTGGLRTCVLNFLHVKSIFMFCLCCYQNIFLLLYGLFMFVTFVFVQKHFDRCRSSWTDYLFWCCEITWFSRRGLCWRHHPIGYCNWSDWTWHAFISLSTGILFVAVKLRMLDTPLTLYSC